jgi:hypothetical protein
MSCCTRDDRSQRLTRGPNTSWIACELPVLVVEVVGWDACFRCLVTGGWGGSSGDISWWGRWQDLTDVELSKSHNCRNWGMTSCLYIQRRLRLYNQWITFGIYSILQEFVVLFCYDWESMRVWVIEVNSLASSFTAGLLYHRDPFTKWPR